MSYSSCKTGDATCECMRRACHNLLALSNTKHVNRDSALALRELGEQFERRYSREIGEIKSYREPEVSERLS